MKLKITVHGVAYEVDVEVLDAKDEMGGSAGFPAAGPGPGRHPAAGAPARRPPRRCRPRRPRPAAAGGGNGVASPIAGTVLEVQAASRARP